MTDKYAHDLVALWKQFGYISGLWLGSEAADQLSAELARHTQPGDEVGHLCAAMVPVLTAHRSRLGELASALLESTDNPVTLEALAIALFSTFEDGPEEGRALCADLLALAGLRVIRRGEALAVERQEWSVSMPVSQDTPGPRQPLITLRWSEKLVLYCIFCGEELGPRPISAMVLASDEPGAEVIGRACGTCLSRADDALADKIDAHAAWWVTTTKHLTLIAELAREGRLKRPSLSEWEAANADALRSLEDGKENRKHE